MATFIQFDNTPIKEIIFTVSFNENVDIEYLGNFIKMPHVLNKFPKVTKSYHTNIQRDSDKAPQATISKDGFILRSSEPEDRILQARRGSFSFHKIKEYEKFPNLLEELESLWIDLESCVGELSVSNISVRYVNFIEKELNENIKDLLTVHLSHPFSSQLNEFYRLNFQYPEEKDVLVNIVCAKAKDNSKDGIILDIILNRALNSEKDTRNIFDSFSKFRSIKNDLFFKCITENTIKKYKL